MLTSLLAALRGAQETQADEIEELDEERKQVLATLKDVAAQIATAIKERQKLDLRVKKVEGMMPPKGADVQTEVAVA